MEKKTEGTGAQEQVMVPLDKWMEITGERIAFRVAHIVIDEHEKRCPIGPVSEQVKELDLAVNGLAGDPNSGLDRRVFALEDCKKKVRGVGRQILSVTMQVLVPVVSTILTMAVTVWIGWSVIESKAKAAEEKPKTEQKSDTDTHGL